MDNGKFQKLKESLPAYSALIGREEFFNSAVLIPLVQFENEYHFLFELRSNQIRQGGEVCFPGGAVEQNDNNIIETAERETIEELGLNKNKIEIIGLLGTYIGARGVAVDACVGRLKINSLDELNVQSTEVEKVFTVPVSFFEKNKPEIYWVDLEIHTSYHDEKGNKVDLLPVKELSLPKQYEQPWKGRKHRVLVYKTEGEIIWGITAGLVFEFIKKIDIVISLCCDCL